jgi:hypothetical protein
MAAPEYWHLVETQRPRARLYDGNDAADAMAAWSRAVSEGTGYVMLESLLRPAPARVASPHCNGFAGDPCPDQVAWLRTYECAAGHATHRRHCQVHDEQVSTLMAAQICGHLDSDGTCVRESELVARRSPQR